MWTFGHARSLGPVRLLRRGGIPPPQLPSPLPLSHPHYHRLPRFFLFSFPSFLSPLSPSSALLYSRSHSPLSLHCPPPPSGAPHQWLRPGRPLGPRPGPPPSPLIPLPPRRTAACFFVLIYLGSTWMIPSGQTGACFPVPYHCSECAPAHHGWL